MRACSRSWQVEAALDGRLTGADLESARRHREQCPECASEARALATLRQQLVQLPPLARDPLASHRGRQRLMTALNDAILAAPPPAKTGRRVSAGLLAVALGAALVLMLRPPKQPPSSAQTLSAVDVDAEPGALWLEHNDRVLDRIELRDGFASFRVHPHPGRRVIVRLPDGEVEDVGTVFDVQVHDGQTLAVRVHAGSVTVRLFGRAEFTLGAGQAWRLAPTSSEPQVLASSPKARSRSDASPRVATQSKPHEGGKSSANPAVVASAVRAPESSRAEDAAYLRIVSLLREQKYPEAQAQAKDYLLRFPNGFRRIEVLNVATQGQPATAD